MTPNISTAAFTNGYLAYQTNEPRDAMYKTATFLVQHYWGNPHDMADGLGVLLLTWNQAFYRYGSFDFARLESVLTDNMPLLGTLRSRDISSLSQADETDMTRLFDEFLEALRIPGGKKSPVSVAKALHLLAPGLMPLWDDKIARAYACYYSVQPAEKYLQFAYEMKTLQTGLAASVPAGCGKTFLKLIDEYNYSKFTKGWV